MATNHIIIYSGGMDSFTLLRHVWRKSGENLARRLHAIGFDYGQRHSRELAAARSVTDSLGIPYTILKLDVLRQIAKGSSLTDDAVDTPHGHYAAENMKKTVVPGRNTVMLSLALAYAEGLHPTDQAVIYYGAHGGDHHIYPDCRPGFITAMNGTIMAASEGRVRLEAPFTEMSKTGILLYGLTELGLTAETYRKTWSCYEGGERPCGACGACTERAEAFRDNQAIDPLVMEAV